MESDLNIKWWRNDDDNIDNEEHVEILKIEAIEKASEMIKEGCSSGELISNISGIEYSGWWEIN